MKILISIINNILVVRVIKDGQTQLNSTDTLLVLEDALTLINVPGQSNKSNTQHQYMINKYLVGADGLSKSFDSDDIDYNLYNYKLKPLAHEILINRYFMNLNDILEVLNRGGGTFDLIPTDKFDEYSKKYPNWEYKSYLYNQRNIVHSELLNPYSAEMSITGYKGCDILEEDTEDKLEQSITLFKENESKARVSKRCTSDLVQFMTPGLDRNIWIVKHLVLSGAYVLANRDNTSFMGLCVNYETEEAAELAKPNYLKEVDNDVDRIIVRKVY